jgi:hypothetical protein
VISECPVTGSKPVATFGRIIMGNRMISEF